MSRIGAVSILIAIVFVFNSANKFAINKEFNSLRRPKYQSDAYKNQIRHLNIPQAYQSTV